MADLDITQKEADKLIAMEKHRIDDRIWDYPCLGGAINIPLVSANQKEHFILDITPGRIDLKKGTYQTRGHKVVVLVWLDFGGAPHRNPNGVEVPTPHLHVYRENYGDKWAYPIPVEEFPDITDLWKTMSDFMNYCNIISPPKIQKGLWI